MPITCQICGDDSVHAIKLHLRDHHPDVTIEEYRAKYPIAPIMSEEAVEQLRKKKAQAEASNVRTQAATAASLASTGQPAKQALSDLFGIRGKGGLAANGNEIMINVLPTPAEEVSRERVPSHSDSYVYNPPLLKTTLQALEMDLPLYLFGPPGVGKSSIIKNVCAKTNRPMVRLQHTPNTEESHIVGEKGVRTVKCPESGQLVSETYYEPGLLPLALKYGWTYVADEYDRAWPSVLSVYQAVLEGEPLIIKEAPDEWRVVHPHPDFRFVATGNTNGAGDETGTMNATVEQDAATMERFAMMEYVDYMDKKAESRMLRQEVGLREEDAKRLVRFATAVRESYPHTLSRNIGNRVLINIANIAISRGDFMAGVRLSYANRLPDAERTAAIEIAQRELGS